MPGPEELARYSYGPRGEVTVPRQCARVQAGSVSAERLPGRDDGG